MSASSSDSGNGDDLDDASLQSMRAVWLSMRDEEPPADGMAALLAAARAKASQLQPQPSWWARFAATLRRPQVLALASVILLAGGALFVRQQQGDEVPEALVARGGEEARTSGVAPVPEPPASARPETPVTPAPHAGQLEAARADGAEDQPSPRKELSSAKLRRKQAPGDRAGPLRSAQAQVASEGRGGTRSAEPEVDDGKVANTIAPQGDVADGERAPAEEPTATKRAVAPTQTTTSDAMITKGTQAPPPSVAQLLQQAERAARRGDCAAVRLLAARIKQQDATFYGARVARHATISTCL